MASDSGIGKEKRASRACLACRTRKTRCDLGDSDGAPPCRRCAQEQQECILVKSRRGGRRVKRSLAIPNGSSLPPPQTPTLSHVAESNASCAEGSPSTTGAADDRWQPRAATSPRQGLRQWDDGWQETASGSTTLRRRSSATSDIENHIASADLLNPSDALDLLAQVADRDAAESRGDLLQHVSRNSTQKGVSQPLNPQSAIFPPIADGYLAVADVLPLLKHYHEKYHPYFPIAHKDIFMSDDVLQWVDKEPHLLTAVLTVASKDEPSWAGIHEACSKHMETLISKLMYRGSTTVGAVEALLILAEWAPQRLQENPTIGRGEEDQGAWMQVGVAIRLGYLQRLEQTGLLQAKDPKPDGFSRKQLAWAACYMSDRHVSIRLGKGFWSRGPGPSTILRAADFPTLQAQQMGSDDLSLLFQAHLELTQLFGNAHDILYSSTSHREALYLGGEYVRYIDDFTSTLRKWKLVWGSLSFTPHVKATLILSYDFLRLYINAFAFQATINRAMARVRQNSSAKSGPLFSDVAGSCDARFIYESIDAANSLLGTLNSFIDPVTGLRYMPIKYYLYVIYAAVFLFKARLAGALGREASGSVRRTIHVTIDRLQRSSVSPDSIGNRYARSLYLLWRKTPQSAAQRQQNDAGQTLASGQPAPDPAMGGGEQSGGGTRGPDLSGFSWRDLDALGQFIANDMSVTDSMLASPSFNSDQTAPGLDPGTNEWYDLLWSGTDVVF
ncbi:hypothetical protein CONLIGDRAFT_694561 [Coniochaeta ligniaria NRRL 30616]|uniref:Zn(2)-C6 fungal-type domain-containing protein n=1 Tax=Coniochaeta ligniaria NRRL 30616 TaxID=1408157 RepID=A0A1J7I5L4_9PEZI|nr:hypothetical protein CONLIGDRAFT_694561 [Coniochaeta ligniaria NRRL 30616]